MHSSLDFWPQFTSEQPGRIHQFCQKLFNVLCSQSRLKVFWHQGSEAPVFGQVVKLNPPNPRQHGSHPKLMCNWNQTIRVDGTRTVPCHAYKKCWQAKLWLIFIRSDLFYYCHRFYGAQKGRNIDVHPNSLKNLQKPNYVLFHFLETCFGDIKAVIWSTSTSSSSSTSFYDDIGRFSMQKVLRGGCVFMRLNLWLMRNKMSAP